MEEIITSIMSHVCNGRLILSSDDPLNHRIGWACIGCGEQWYVRIVDAKEHCPDLFREIVGEAEARLKFTAFLNRGAGCLYAWNEERLPT